MNQRWEKGSSGLCDQFRFITLIFAFFIFGGSKRDLLLWKGFVNPLFWWFSSHSKSNTGEGFSGWKKVWRKKVKEWFTFLTIVVGKVYRLNGTWVGFIRPNSPYQAVSLEWILFSDLNAEVSQGICILLHFAYTCISFFEIFLTICCMCKVNYYKGSAKTLALFFWRNFIWHSYIPSFCKISCNFNDKLQHFECY